MLMKLIKNNIILLISMILIFSACTKTEAPVVNVTEHPATATQAPTAKPTPTASPTPAPTSTPAPKVQAPDDGRPWYIRVDTSNQLVSVYALDDEAKYTRLINQFASTAGKRDDFTKKLFQVLNDEEKYRWKFFSTFGGGYCEYVTRIYRPFLFHSIIFNEKDEDTLMVQTYIELTFPASHGCIRLMPQDAKWVYDNCIAGTYVEVVDDRINPEIIQSYMPPPLIDGKYLPSQEVFGEERRVDEVIPNWDNFPSDGGWRYDPDVYE